MENVLGIQSAAGGEYFTRVQHEARLLGYRVVAQIAECLRARCAAEAPTSAYRRRARRSAGFFPDGARPAPRAFPGTTIGPAIGDLPRLTRAGRGVRGLRFRAARAHLARWGNWRAVIFSSVRDGKRLPFTAHRARPHSERDLRDFALLREGENSAKAMRPASTSSSPTTSQLQGPLHPPEPPQTVQHHRRAPQQGWADVHPPHAEPLTHPARSRAPSELPGLVPIPRRTHAPVSLIGNAVPPLVGEAVGLEVRAFLEAKGSTKRDTAKSANRFSFDGIIPSSQAEAAVRLQGSPSWIAANSAQCERPVFLRGWFALFYLFPGLIPTTRSTTATPVRGGHRRSWRFQAWKCSPSTASLAADGLSRWSCSARSLAALRAG